MKQLLIAINCLVLFSITDATAQYTDIETPRSTVNLNTGFSLTGLVFRIVEVVDSAEGNELEISNTPAAQVRYDYRIHDLISLGGAFSIQRFKVNILDKGEVRANRINLALQALIHYGSNERIDMYSGIRGGLINWGLDVKSDDIEFVNDFENNLINRAAVQVVAYGIHYYFNPNIGMNMEVGIGAPHYLSMGLSARF